MLKNIPTWIVASVALVALIGTFVFFYMRPNEPQVSEGSEAADEVWTVVSNSSDWNINDPVVSPTGEKTRWSFRANIAHAGGATLLPAYGFVDFRCEPGEERAECWKITGVVLDGQAVEKN